LNATLKTNAIGGIVFDGGAANRYKFVALDVATQSVIIGHVEPGRGWVVDTSVSRTLSASSDYAVGLILNGTTVSVTINGAFVKSWSFNAPVVDGAVGVLSRGGTTSFDVYRVRTNDPAFAPAGSPSAPDAPTVADELVAPDDYVLLSRGESITPVTAVTVTMSSTSWSPDFVAALAAAGLGTNGYRLPIGAPSQLAPLPWANVDQIRLQFSHRSRLGLIHCLRTRRGANRIASFLLRSRDLHGHLDALRTVRFGPIRTVVRGLTY
jgi:hypothetical protein